MKYVSLYQDMMTYDMYEEIVKMVAGKKNQFTVAKILLKIITMCEDIWFLVQPIRSMEGISLIFTTKKLN